MSYLLDTIAISDWRKKIVNAGLVEWFSQRQPEELYLSVVTIGEIERGIRSIEKRDPKFARQLTIWLEQTVVLYKNRILDVGVDDARLWGQLSAELGNYGADLLIAATAMVRNLTVVTRNTGHFEPTGVQTVNPWS